MKTLKDIGHELEEIKAKEILLQEIAASNPGMITITCAGSKDLIINENYLEFYTLLKQYFDSLIEQKKEEARQFLNSEK